MLSLSVAAGSESAPDETTVVLALSDDEGGRSTRETDERVTGFDTPYPHSLEWAYFPGPIRTGEAIDKLLGA